ncbi:MAG: DM13 domain-containing protein [Microbacterium sp.]
MRKTILTAAIPVAVIALGLTLAGCSSTPSSDMTDGAPMSQESEASTDMMETKTMGEFAGLNGKSVAGTVTIENGTITLADFSSDEGPDLHIYLTNGTDEAAVGEGMQVDAVAFDEASQTFTLEDADVSAYTYVVIHCDKAKAVFGAAELS